MSPPPILSFLNSLSPTNFIPYIVIKASIPDRIFSAVTSNPKKINSNIIIIIQDDATISSSIIIYSISLTIITISDDMNIRLIISSFVNPKEWYAVIYNAPVTISTIR